MGDDQLAATGVDGQRFAVGDLSGKQDIVVCLIHQTNYLLDRQIKQLEAAFLKEGGLRERMTRARLEARRRG